MAVLMLAGKKSERTQSDHSMKPQRVVRALRLTRVAIPLRAATAAAG